MFRQQREFDHTKIMNHFEIAVSFPTEMSLPFIYTLDVPTLVRLNGKAKFESVPNLSSENTLRKPNKMNLQTETRLVLSSTMQSKMSFIMPFNSQQYTSGLTKNMQLYLPLTSDISYDVRSGQLRATVQPIEPKRNLPLVQYQTVPYTMAHLISDLHAETTKTGFKAIENSKQIIRNKIVGAKHGMAFKIQYTKGQHFMNPEWIINQLKQNDLVSILYAPCFETTLQQNRIEISYDADNSPAHKIEIQIGHMRSYQIKPATADSSITDIKMFKQLPMESKQRQERMIQWASSGINNCKTFAVDANIKFVGQPNIEYTLTGAVSKSNVQPQARTLFFFNKQSRSQEIKPYQVAISLWSKFPNTNGLDYQYALHFDSKSQVQVQFGFGEDYTKSNQIKLDVNLRKSEERKNYLESLPQAKECRRQMQQGSYQLPACANLTQAANLLDQVDIELRHEHLSDRALNNSAKLYSLLRQVVFFKLDENWVNPERATQPKHMSVQARFYPDLEAMNLTLRAEKLVARFDNIRMNDLAQRLLVVHPVFSAPARVAGAMYKWGTYRRKILFFMSYFKIIYILLYSDLHDRRKNCKHFR